MKTCQRVVYSGRVQGVGFRYSVKQIAAGFDVTGWVRNLPDGTVEMLAAGEPAEVKAFAAAVSTSHLGGYIKETTVEKMADADGPTGSGFVIRH